MIMNRRGGREMLLLGGKPADRKGIIMRRAQTPTGDTALDIGDDLMQSIKSKKLRMSRDHHRGAADATALHHSPPMKTSALRK